MSKLGDKIRSIPVIGPVVRFPGRVKQGLHNAKNALENIPGVGPYAIRPTFEGIGAAHNYMLGYPRFIATHIVTPFAVAGAVSAGLQYLPDVTSEDIESFMKREGLNLSALDNIDHENIRVYRSDTTVLNAFHMAGQMADKAGDRMAEMTDTGLFVNALVTAASYPPMLVTSFLYANVEKNAFTLALTNDEDTCFIANNAYSADPKEMIAALSGLPLEMIALESEDLSWVPAAILLHEAKHCDNGKETFRNIDVLMNDPFSRPEETKTEPTEEEEKSQINFTMNNIQEVIDQIVLMGEESSDIHALESLQAEFPGSVDVLRASRAIQPFTGNMNMSSNHATAHALEQYFSGEDTSTTFHTWEAIEMAKMLIHNAREMNFDSTSVDAETRTLMNYHVAKNHVIPFLQERQDAAFPREDEMIKFALVLEHVELFVEAMESSLVKPEYLDPEMVSTPAGNIIPDFTDHYEPAQVPEF